MFNVTFSGWSKSAIFRKNRYLWWKHLISRHEYLTTLDEGRCDSQMAKLYFSGWKVVLWWKFHHFYWNCSFTVLHRHSLAYTLLHCHSLAYTLLHCLTLSFTVLHCLTLSWTVLHCHSLAYTLLHCHSLACTLLHCHSLAYILLHCHTLSYIYLCYFIHITLCILDL